MGEDLYWDRDVRSCLEVEGQRTRPFEKPCIIQINKAQAVLEGRNWRTSSDLTAVRQILQ
jgi:hypothetical protein